MNKFWNFRDEDGQRILDLNGPIAEETWWGDEVTPQMFRDELESVVGDIKVSINSPGGDVFAAAQMYNILKAHRGKVTVFIDSLAASAASVVAMAGDEVVMSPVGMLMIHNPSTVAIGDHNDMEKTLATLNEVKESIINAYQAKTHKSRKELSDMMEAETWMNANTALEKGFIDRIEGEVQQSTQVLFGARAADTALVNKIVAKFEGEKPAVEPQKESISEKGTALSEINARLDAIKKLI